MADKWQYMILNLDAQKQLVSQSSEGSNIEVNSDSLNSRGFIDAFDRLGEEGWELVGIDPGDRANAYWFKRPRIDTSGEVHVY